MSHLRTDGFVFSPLLCGCAGTEKGRHIPMRKKGKE